MIFLDNRQDKVEVTEELEKTIKSVIECALKEEKVKFPCEISVVFIDNENIKSINRENRNVDKITDVLSFPMLEYPEGKVFKQIYLNHKFHEYDMNDGNLVLGDIVISLEKAKEQSKEFGHSFFRETCYLIVHSVLHLLGYDHMKDEDKKLMRKREEEILQDFRF
ncbi:rRNA maturation RNase YbeY [Clostridium sp. WILCCON 0269]|uniref:Endoribonuclease YbeY n=1 Tax=Candidatus Clostridium eludens TaxID=3381663 RepID=A0ABW8SII3_9CLOT